MARKVREYFEAGVVLVWLIDPKKRTARVFSKTREVDAGPGRKRGISTRIEITDAQAGLLFMQGACLVGQKS